MTPYTWNTTPLYGHYALFFLLPVKLFGKKIFIIAACISMIAVVEQLTFIYIINSIKIKNWIKAIITIAAITRQTYIYPAITPIRTLWPVLMCAWICYINKKKCFSRWLAGYVLAGFAILWNTETGIGCLAGIFMYNCWMMLCEQKQEEIVDWKSIIELVLKNVLASFVPLIIALFIVNIYNICCGLRNIEIASFFYPYLGSDWAIDELRCNIPLGNHAWVYVIILMLTCLSVSVIELFRANPRTEYAKIFGIATVGLVVFTYYFNEAHWGCLDVIRKICAMLSAFAIAKFYSKLTINASTIRDQMIKTVCLLLLIIWGSVGINALMNDPVRISRWFGMRVYSSIETEVNQQILGKVPSNIFGIGQGINVIYSELGWYNYPKCRDTSSLDIADNNNAYDQFLEEILVHEDFLIGDTLYWDVELQKNILLRDNRYVKLDTYEIGEYRYAYYTRREN